MPTPLKTTIVGALALDHRKVINTSLGEIDGDAKYTEIWSGHTLGGAGGNLVSAYRALDTAFSTQSEIELFTRVGEEDPEDDDDAAMVNWRVRRWLKRLNITHTETSSGPCSVAHNLNLEHLDGRLIIRDGKHKTGELAHGIEERIYESIAGSDINFVDPRKYRTGPIAARAAAENQKMLITDFGESAWPEDSGLAEAYNCILSNATIAIVPDDAIVRGMKPGQKNPDELFVRLQHDFGFENILMSNSSAPVRILVDGVEDELPVQRHDGIKYTNGAGDTRNAGMVWALNQGHGLREAFQFGTDVASVKVKYPGLEWQEHIADELGNHPIFF